MHSKVSGQGFGPVSKNMFFTTSLLMFPDPSYISSPVSNLSRPWVRDRLKVSVGSVPVNPLQSVSLSKHMVLRGKNGDGEGGGGCLKSRQFSALIPPITVLPISAASEDRPGAKGIQIRPAY